MVYQLLECAHSQEAIIKLNLLVQDSVLDLLF